VREEVGLADVIETAMASYDSVLFTSLLSLSSQVTLICIYAYDYTGQDPADILNLNNTLNID
jgi:hypothetical protein